MKKQVTPTTAVSEPLVFTSLKGQVPFTIKKKKSSTYLETAYLDLCRCVLIWLLHTLHMWAFWACLNLMVFPQELSLAFSAYSDSPLYPIWKENKRNSGLGCLHRTLLTWLNIRKSWDLFRKHWMYPSPVGLTLQRYPRSLWQPSFTHAS